MQTIFSKKSLSLLAAGALLGLVSQYALAQNYVSADTEAAIATSFQAKGQAGLDRLKQDQTNAACTMEALSGKPLSDYASSHIEAANLASIKAPSDGQYLGDWKAGEKIAQNGKGWSWKDKPSKPAGGNCYNCHQIDKASIGGTIGPNLWNYGKLRGVTDPNSPATKVIVEYTWGKLNNAKAYLACSNMPRFDRVLDEQQIKDIMALLLDPASPVNQ